MELLDWLTDWYASNCNQDWEHTYGISIATLDNPGWSIEIDLIDTQLEGRQLSEISMKNSDIDWYNISSTGKRFTGYGDGKKLNLLILKLKPLTNLTYFLKNGS